MKIRQTFEFGGETREAIGREMGCRRSASRTQCVQWVTETMTLAKLDAVRRLRTSKVNPNPDQQTFADLERQITGGRERPPE